MSCSPDAFQSLRVTGKGRNKMSHSPLVLLSQGLELGKEPRFSRRQRAGIRDRHVAGQNVLHVGPSFLDRQQIADVRRAGAQFVGLLSATAYTGSLTEGGLVQPKTLPLFSKAVTYPWRNDHFPNQQVLA